MAASACSRPRAISAMAAGSSFVATTLNGASRVVPLADDARIPTRADDGQRGRRRMRAAFGAAGNMNLERTVEMRRGGRGDLRREGARGDVRRCADRRAGAGDDAPARIVGSTMKPSARRRRQRTTSACRVRPTTMQRPAGRQRASQRAPAASAASVNRCSDIRIGMAEGKADAKAHVPSRKRMQADRLGRAFGAGRDGAGIDDQVGNGGTERGDAFRRAGRRARALQRPRCARTSSRRATATACQRRRRPSRGRRSAGIAAERRHATSVRRRRSHQRAAARRRRDASRCSAPPPSIDDRDFRRQVLRSDLSASARRKSAASAPASMMSCGISPASGSVRHRHAVARLRCRAPQPRPRNSGADAALKPAHLDAAARGDLDDAVAVLPRRRAQAGEGIERDRADRQQARPAGRRRSASAPTGPDRRRACGERCGAVMPRPPHAAAPSSASTSLRRGCQKPRAAPHRAARRWRAAAAGSRASGSRARRRRRDRRRARDRTARSATAPVVSAKSTSRSTVSASSAAPRGPWRIWPAMKRGLIGAGAHDAGERASTASARAAAADRSRRA